MAWRSSNQQYQCGEKAAAASGESGSMKTGNGGGESGESGMAKTV